MSSSPPQQRRQWYEADDAAAQVGAGAPPPLHGNHQLGHAPPGIAGRGPHAGAAATPAHPDSDHGGTHAPIGLPRSIGIPPAGSHYRRSRVASRFSLSQLPSIDRSSVTLWRTLEQAFPPYLRSSSLGTAVQQFLGRVLGPTQAVSLALTVTVKRLEDGTEQESTHEAQEVTIGTHATSKVLVGGIKVSRHHARLVFEEGACQLVDQGSSNGTFLRGDRIQSGFAYPLQNGEAFSIPGHEVTVRWPESRPAPTLAGLRVGALRLATSEEFVAGIPSTGLAAVCRLEPGGARVLIELPLPLCHLLCARVMGLPGGPQAGQPLSAQDAMPVRPLGEVDKGILELLCVKLLHEVQAAWGASAELTLTLERLLGGNDRRLTQMLPPGPIVNASIALEFDQMRESVRLAIPAGAASTLAERLPRSTDRAGQTTEELYFRYRELIDLARVEFACRIGEMKVSRTEWAQLELGAICFPDQLDLTIEGETVAGTVEAYPAYGTGGAKIHTRLTEYGAPLKVTIESIETDGAQRPESTNGNEAAMTEAQAGAPQEHVGEGVGMLDAVPMAMVIELGRLSMTVRDLAALRRGQVLELGSGADDPVNLVVDGHLVGQGKLVNVEGEIGIQIIDLMR